MDEDRKSYITRAIYDLAEVTPQYNKYYIADILNSVSSYHPHSIISNEEWVEIVKDFQENDAVWESIVDKTADLEQLHKEAVDRVEAFLFGGTSGTSIDGIIQWINSPDCSKRELLRLKEAIDKTLG